eukprot:GHVU01196376.1.p2 GENE.GHVU01196376.1~~GHVU01196376.1.p2  ORF type:complete len:101 (+),score=4.94 GHVU01196376.1:1982-2284(+)
MQLRGTRGVKAYCQMVSINLSVGDFEILCEGFGEVRYANIPFLLIRATIMYCWERVAVVDRQLRIQAQPSASTFIVCLVRTMSKAMAEQGEVATIFKVQG